MWNCWCCMLALDHQIRSQVEWLLGCMRRGCSVWVTSQWSLGSDLRSEKLAGLYGGRACVYICKPGFTCNLYYATVRTPKGVKQRTETAACNGSVMIWCSCRMQSCRPICSSTGKFVKEKTTDVMWRCLKQLCMALLTISQPETRSGYHTATKNRNKREKNSATPVAVAVQHMKQT